MSKHELLTRIKFWSSYAHLKLWEGEKRTNNKTGTVIN